MLTSPGGPCVSFVRSIAGVAACVPLPPIGHMRELARLSVLTVPKTMLVARQVVPVRIVVTLHTKVRTTDHFQVVRQTGMANGELIRRQVRRMGQLVYEGRVWVVENLAVAVILHHDEEHVVQPGKPARA